MKSVTLRRPALREELRRYLLAFLLGFGSLLVVILPWLGSNSPRIAILLPLPL